MSTRAFHLTETLPLPRPARDWLLDRLDETWPQPSGAWPVEIDTRFEQAVLAVASIVAVAIVLCAVSGLLGFLLGLLVAA